MRLHPIVALALIAGASLHAQPAAPAGFLMPRDAELALASSAAPPNITSAATLEVFNGRAFEVARRGTNGFVCLVLRGWSAPTFTPAAFRALINDPRVRAPICYNPAAARTVLPYQKMRTALALEGKTADQIATAITAAYASHALPQMEGVAFAYMFSASQNLGPGIGAFHPHVMVFTPRYENAMLGGNAFGGPLPFVSDDAGTPFAVTVIPVAHDLAVRSVTP